MVERWTPKREAFLRHYISNGFNATAAARSAGYKHANKLGPRLVKMGIFQDRLNALLREAGMGPEECQARIGRIARTPITRFYKLNEDGSGPVIDWQAVIEGEDSDLVQEIRVDGVVLKGADRLRALELIGKSFGLFVDRVIEERGEEQPISNAVLEQAMEQLRLFEQERGEIIKDWRARVREAGAGS
jgi:phage terminase small subunit